MEYRQTSFNALIQEVEAQGGALLPDKCEPRKIDYSGTKVPMMLDPDTAEPVDTYTCGCGNATRIVLIYDSEQENKNGFATVCAVCDNVGAMPNFEAAVKEEDDSYWKRLRLS